MALSRVAPPKAGDHSGGNSIRVDFWPVGPAGPHQERPRAPQQVFLEGFTGVGLRSTAALAPLWASDIPRTRCARLVDVPRAKTRALSCSVPSEGARERGPPRVGPPQLLVATLRRGRGGRVGHTGGALQSYRRCVGAGAGSPLKSFGCVLRSSRPPLVTPLSLPRAGHRSDSRHLQQVACCAQVGGRCSATLAGRRLVWRPDRFIDTGVLRTIMSRGMSRQRHVGSQDRFVQWVAVLPRHFRGDKLVIYINLLT